MTVMVGWLRRRRFRPTSTRVTRQNGILWDRASAQLLARWLFAALVVWSIGNVLVTQLRAPFALRSIQGWRDAFTYLMWTAPLAFTPLVPVVIGWLMLMRMSMPLTRSRVGHAFSLVVLLPILLAVELVASSLFLFLIGAKPSPTPGGLLTAWLEPGQPLEWFITNATMILVPRIVLNRRLRQSGLVDYV